jgi:hypothetical protein
VSRQYSDKSCPRSSDRKAFKKRQNIALNQTRLQCRTVGSSMTMISFDMELSHLET